MATSVERAHAAHPPARPARRGDAAWRRARRAEVVAACASRARCRGRQGDTHVRAEAVAHAAAAGGLGAAGAGGAWCRRRWGGCASATSTGRATRGVQSWAGASGPAPLRGPGRGGGCGACAPAPGRQAPCRAEPRRVRAHRRGGAGVRAGGEVSAMPAASGISRVALALEGLCRLSPRPERLDAGGVGAGGELGAAERAGHRRVWGALGGGARAAARGGVGGGGRGGGRGGAGWGAASRRWGGGAWHAPSDRACWRRCQQPSARRGGPLRMHEPRTLDRADGEALGVVGAAPGAAGGERGSGGGGGGHLALASGAADTAALGRLGGARAAAGGARSRRRCAWTRCRRRSPAPGWRGLAAAEAEVWAVDEASAAVAGGAAGTDTGAVGRGGRHPVRAPRGCGARRHRRCLVGERLVTAVSGFGRSKGDARRAGRGGHVEEGEVHGGEVRRSRWQV